MKKLSDIELEMDWARFWQKIQEQNPEATAFRQMIRVVYFAGMQNVVGVLAAQEDRIEALWECQKQLSVWALEVNT